MSAVEIIEDRDYLLLAQSVDLPSELVLMRLTIDLPHLLGKIHSIVVLTKDGLGQLKLHGKKDLQNCLGIGDCNVIFQDIIRSCEEILLRMC